MKRKLITKTEVLNNLRKPTLMHDLLITMCPKYEKRHLRRLQAIIETLLKKGLVESKVLVFTALDPETNQTTETEKLGYVRCTPNSCATS